MKRSEINEIQARVLTQFGPFAAILPPDHMRAGIWDITDFGLGDFNKWGLVLANVDDEREYCQKLMWAAAGQRTPRHHHGSKKENIRCLSGNLHIELFGFETAGEEVEIDWEEFVISEHVIKVKINGEMVERDVREELVLGPGDVITLPQGLDHEFWGGEDGAVVQEVSMGNDDTDDNYFEDEEVGRFSEIEEDEEPIVKLVSD